MPLGHFCDGERKSERVCVCEREREKRKEQERGGKILTE